jgi:hypothetical protein
VNLTTADIALIAIAAAVWVIVIWGTNITA